MCWETGKHGSEWEGEGSNILSRPYLLILIIMPESFLLGLWMLQLNSEVADIITDLSAVTLTPTAICGWVPMKRLQSSVCRLSRLIFLENIKDLRSQILLIYLENAKSISKELISAKIIFGWSVLTAPNAKKAKGKNPEKDIERLAQIVTEVNRYLLARIPIKDGILCKSIPDSDNPEIQLTVGCLQRTETGNLLNNRRAQR